MELLEGGDSPEGDGTPSADSPRARRAQVTVEEYIQVFAKKIVSNAIDRRSSATVR